MLVEAEGSVPHLMNYQGRLTNASGAAVSDGNYTIQMSIYGSATSGSAIWQETQTIPIKNGIFNLVIGSNTTGGIPLSFDKDYWLGTKVETDPEMTPRQQLVSGAYSFRADQAGTATYSLTAGTGTQGPQGTQGLTGAIGTTGLQGQQGTIGATGQQGTIGATGQQGTIGVTGQQGTQGAIGTQGLQGIQGTQGETGTIGTTATYAGTATYALTAGTSTWSATATYALSANRHYIGESYGGGKVFYVYDNGQHGLIAATADQSPGIRWYGGSYANTRARADGVGAGKANTAIIIANQGPVDGNAFAATVCNEYSVTVDGVTYGDWYLPSKYELNLLYLQKNVVGGFANSSYWSSTEANSAIAWYQYFVNGNQHDFNKPTTYYVRAVRAF